MVHVLFGPEVRLMLQEDDDAGMKAFCEHLHPATVAEALAGEFTVDEVWRFLSHTGIKHQAAVFEYFPIDWQVKMVEGTGRQHMAKLIEQMAPDDRADLLRRLMPRVADALLRLVDEADRRDIATLVGHQENTAGALMTTDYAWLPANITAAEALDRLRLQAPDRETIYYVYVLDEQRRLLGVVSLRNLILAPRHARVGDIMDREPVAVRVTDDRELVAREMARYDLLAIPVLDGAGRLVGIVTHDDVIDVVVQEATEDVHRLGAVGPITENYLEAHFVTVWRKRAVWLACLFIAELFTFTALSYFDEAINEVVVLALFVPLCISTGGNSGSQAATLITRAIALGQVRAPDWVRVLRHELFMGLALGLTLGCIGFLRGALTPEDVRGNLARRKEPFEVRVPSDAPQEVREEHKGFWFWERKRVVTVSLPAGAVQRSPVDKSMQVILPEGERPTVTEPEPGRRAYHFPADSEIRYEAVSRWRLAWVVTQAVALICLWGTLIGSMLPIIFKRLGVDPGIASSPFVATFVDVTGIVIYFSIAKVYLLP
jgi:magnesium transporter